jgi:hypothetical protein
VGSRINQAMKKPPEIKAPCPVRWDEMRGDSRSRYCDHCQLHVHNLSALPRRRVARILERSARERTCVTYTRRVDGSMVTRATLARERVVLSLRRAFSYVMAAFVPVALGACATQPARPQPAGRIDPRCQTEQKRPPAATEERVVVTGGVLIRE